MNPQSPQACPECGKPIPVESPHQLCPACLMAQALVSRTIGGDGEKASAMPSLTPEEVADSFPQFEIAECLGRGGMGVIYKARQKSLDRWVAIKILAPERRNNEKFAERFAREAHALAKLNHPNIVTIYDFGQTVIPQEAGAQSSTLNPQLFYIVMEFVDGVNLRDLLREGKLEASQALAIVPPICDALQYAHEKGIVHRDIKPENLLLDREGRVKVADFGIAALVGAEGEPSGTPQYMAPEQTDTRREVDHRADIYALGVVLYEMLTGERPAKEVIAPSRKVQLDVRLDEIVLRALEKTPELRYEHASIFKTQVETIAGSPAARPETMEQEKRIRFSRTAIVGACWASLSLLAIFGGFIVQWPVRPEVGSLAWWQILLTVALLPLEICSPFGTTILGWVAVSQIRRSEGKLWGLGLAVAEGLLFPLLVLDYGIAWFLYQLGIALHLWTKNYDPVSSAILTVCSIVAWVVVDGLIIRRVWCAVNRTGHASMKSRTGLEHKRPPRRNPTASGVCLLLIACLLMTGLSIFSLRSTGAYQLRCVMEIAPVSSEAALQPSGRLDELLAMAMRWASSDAPATDQVQILFSTQPGTDLVTLTAKSGNLQMAGQALEAAKNRIESGFKNLPDVKFHVWETKGIPSTSGAAVLTGLAALLTAVLLIFPGIILVASGLLFRARQPDMGERRSAPRIHEWLAVGLLLLALLGTPLLLAFPIREGSVFTFTLMALLLALFFGGLSWRNHSKIGPAVISAILGLVAVFMAWASYKRQQSVHLMESMQIEDWNLMEKGIEQAREHRNAQAARASASSKPLSPSATANPRLEEKPKLQFLAWQSDSAVEAMKDIRHPDGSKVTAARELKWLSTVQPGYLESASSAPQKTSRVLQFWISHPLFDLRSLNEISVQDLSNPNRTIILNDRKGEICTSPMATDDAGGHLGWFATGLRLNPDLSLPDRVTVQLRYTVGPLENPREIMVKPHARISMSLEGGADLSVVGQTIDNQAFVAITVPASMVQTRQFSVMAVTANGQQLICGPSISGSADGKGILTEEFDFETPLSKVKQFIIGTRPVKTVEWKAVELPAASGATINPAGDKNYSTP